MIKINLASEKKQTKARSATPVARTSSGPGMGQNVLLVVLLLVGVAVSGIWWYTLNSRQAELRQEHADADTELKRLEEIRRKGEEYKAQKELLARKIGLITELKRQQAVPVHLLDKVSRNLPEFLWLESMTASANQVNITGKATNYNSVSSFYQNLVDSGQFLDVNLGRTFEVKEGVSFSLSARFMPAGAVEADPAEQDAAS